MELGCHFSAHSGKDCEVTATNDSLIPIEDFTRLF